MNGIHCAVVGRLTADAELKYTGQGAALLSFSIAVNDDKRAGDGAPEWLKCSLWDDEAERLADVLRKGVEIYAEGRVKLATWTMPTGESRTGLNCTVWRCTPLGTIGRRAPRRGPRVDIDSYATAGGT